MKNKKSKSIFKKGILQLFLLLTACGLFAQNIEKNIVKTTNLASNVEIKIDNSNFDVNIKTWDKAQLKVDYKLTISAKNEAELNDFYKELEKNIDEQLKDINSGSVSISFPFKQMSRNNRKVEIVFKNSSRTYELTEFKASTTIYAPNKNNLDISSNFCTIMLENTLADVTANLSSSTFEMGNCKNLKLKAGFCKNMKVGNINSGIIELSSSDADLGNIGSNLNLKASFSNFKSQSVGGNAKLELSSSTFETSDVKDIDIDASFVRKFVVNNAENVTVSRFNSSEMEANSFKSLKIENTSFSTFRIGKVDTISIGKSSSSKFYVKNVSTVDAGNCSFSNFTINELKTGFRADSKSGSIQIDKLTAGFKKIDIDGQFVNIDITTEENCNYKISADLEFPNYRFKDVKFNNINKNMSSEKFDGIRGTNNNVPSELIFNCKSCTIRIN